jgi:hypothetical protein
MILLINLKKKLSKNFEQLFLNAYIPCFCFYISFIFKYCSMFIFGDICGVLEICYVILLVSLTIFYIFVYVTLDNNNNISHN